MTWRDDVGGGEYEPVRAGWEILDSARTIAFTGEIEFPLLPVARVYLDRGRIYYAARADHPDVADRLVALGAVRPDDLARGVLVSAGVDHLGRLFDRVPALDQQRVMLALEQITHETTAWVASQSVGAAVTRPYVYHPSGVHQWYARPTSPSPAAVFPAPVPPTRPARTAPAEQPVTPPPDPPRADVDWSEPSAPSEPVASPQPAASSEPGRPQQPSELPRRPQPAESPRSSQPFESSAAAHLEVPGSEFELRWPSGEVGVPEPPAPADTASSTGGLDRFDRLDPDAPVIDPETAAEIGDDLGDLDDAEHREMTIAVRRAMAAVASGTARGRPVGTVVPVLDDDPDPFDRWPGADTERTERGQPDHDPDDPFTMPVDREVVPGVPLAPPLPSERRLVDERRSALQRLIDGLRNR